MRRPLAITLGLALLAGAAVGWLASRRSAEARALEAIVSPDAEVRAAGWRWWRGPAGGDEPPRAAGRLDVIAPRLRAGPDAALLDAGDELRTLDLWSWSRAPHDLVLRDLTLRAQRGREDDVRRVIDALDAAPRELPVDDVLAIVEPIVSAREHDVDVAAALRQEALHAAAAWLGPQRVAALGALDTATDDAALSRARRLVLLWAPEPRPLPPVEPDAPVDVQEAILLLHTLHREPDDAALAAVERLHEAGVASAAYLLRHADGSRAFSLLERWADAGDATARFVLHDRQRGREDAAARQRVNDARLQPWQRRLAAWRWDNAPADDVYALLQDAPVADEDGTVYAAVLLAERHLPHADAADLAERWIRSFDDDRKRAGALLAALLGGHRDLLRAAHDAENDGSVRTAQRLALMAFGEPVGPGDDMAFAHRASHLPSGDFDPDTVLALLIAGHAPALAHLVEPPHAPWRPSIQQRAWLIERFIPAWHDALGRPIGSDLRSIDLHFDALRALHAVTRRRMSFSAPSRTYAPAPPLHGGD